MRKRLNVTWLICGLLFVSSCHVDDLGKVKPGTISPNLAINLGFSEYTVEELLNDLSDESLEVVTDSDLTMAMYFNESSIFNDNDEIILVNSVNNVSEFAPAVDVASSPIGYQIPIDETFTFAFNASNGEEIDSVVYRAGTLDFEMISTFKGDVDYTWTIVGTREVSQNTDFTQSKVISYSGSLLTDTYTRPLDGLKSKFIENGLGENEFDIRVVGTISFEEGTEILPSQKMTFDLSFNDPEFRNVYGYFGNEPVNLQNQSINMSAFKNLSGDGLLLKDPRVYLIMDNSYGIDMELSFDALRAIGENKSEILLEEKDPPGIDKFVSSPEVVGEIIIDTVELNNTNSNIDILLNSAPDSLVFQISATPNPASSLRTSNFLTDTSQIFVKSLIAIPMEFQMNGFKVDFDFDLDGLDIEDAESLTFNITATNEIPFSGIIDLNFVDSNGEIFYTIKDAANIDSPGLDSSGKSIEPKISKSGVDLSDEAIDALIIAEQVLATVNIYTFESDKDRYVTLYADYKLNIELSLAGEVILKL